jgi:hypothetical protein
MREKRVVINRIIAELISYGEDCTIEFLDDVLDNVEKELIPTGGEE